MKEKSAQEKRKDKMEHIYSSLSLAYIGDSVYETYIRTRLLENGDRRVKEFHRAAKQYVSAKAQCAIARRITDSLSEEEMTVFKRGRNTKVNTKAKNAGMAEYHTATGLEALIGNLYLSKNEKRLKEILELCYNTANEILREGENKHEM